jgi:DNA-binding LacI/PurR family transcriptional regulator
MAGRTAAFIIITNPPMQFLLQKISLALGVIKESEEERGIRSRRIGVVGFAMNCLVEHTYAHPVTLSISKTIGMGRSALKLILDIIERTGLIINIKQKIVLDLCLSVVIHSNRKKFANAE